MSGATEKNPKLFRELQEPFESVEVANAEALAFLEAVGELRKKHRISEVLTVLCVRTLNDKGAEAEAMLPHYYGDSLHAEGVAAYAFGQFAAARQEAISQMVGLKAIRDYKASGKR